MARVDMGSTQMTMRDYPADFKADAVALYRSARSDAQAG